MYIESTERRSVDIIEGTDFIDDNYLNLKDIENEFDNELLNYAVHYARLGYPIFPLHNLVKKYGVWGCSCKQGINCSSSGKHPRTYNGFKDATTDEKKIITWWENHPSANIGLLTGRKSGIFVLDIDIKADAEIPYNGEITFEIMQEKYKCLLGENFTPLPRTLTAISGSGCHHLYFKYNLDLTSKTSQSKIGLGLDIKSDDGYIVAPPSNHKSGNKYQWFGVNTPIEDAPDWLHYEIQVARQPKRTEKQKSSDKTQVVSSKSYSGEVFQDGERNDNFHTYVSGLVNSHTKENVLSFARRYSNERCNPPLTEREIISIVNWAWRRKEKGWKK